MKYYCGTCLEQMTECQCESPVNRDYHVGQSVRMKADFTPLSSGVIEALEPTGAKVGGLWFGWHELSPGES